MLRKEHSKTQKVLLVMCQKLDIGEMGLMKFVSH